MSLTALDGLNFFLADVRGGLGPYVNVLLVTDAHWSQFAVGSVLMVSGLIGVAAHPSVGGFIDRTHAKREAIILGAFLLSACALAIATWPILPVVFIADVTMAVLGGLFAPSIAAITLGLCGHEALAARLGRNAAFDKAGNVFIALIAGIVGLAVSQRAPFYLVPLFAILTTAAAFSIPGRAIDHARARGLEPSANQEEHPARWRVLFHYRPLVVFAAAAAIFYFADAPMLPLIAQRLALAHPGWETGLTSLSIVLAQLVTILMALLVTRANAIGRRPLLIAAFVALVIRGALCVGFGDAAALLLLQALEGVTGGLFEALLPLILADVMEGTGRYSLARGVVGTVQGIGGSCSQAAAGFLVSKAGYPSAFFALTLIAAAGLLLVLLLLPETTPATLKKASRDRHMQARRAPQ
jgi:predicted MFS family arabinose efflux permease